MVAGFISQGLKQPQLEANYLPPSNACVKNCWICASNNPIHLEDGPELNIG